MRILMITNLMKKIVTKPAVLTNFTELQHSPVEGTCVTAVVLCGTGLQL